MSRRITSKPVDKVNRPEAIQPGRSEQVDRLIHELLEALPASNGMTVIHVSSTKGVNREGATASSKVDHRWNTLIIIEHLPQSTAKEEVAGGGEATRTRKGDQRLVELVKVLLKRIDKLLYDCFLQKLAEESGKEVAKALKWLVVLVTLFLLARC